MKEYTVYIYGRRNKVERVSCSVQTNSDTYRQELGYLDDVTIYGYEVGI